MDRVKLLTFAVIGLLLLNLLTISFLVLKPDRSLQSGLRNAEGPANIIIERLHFDQNQQQDYQKLIYQHQQQMRVLTDEMVQLHREYYGLLGSPTTGSVLKNSLSHKIGANQKAQSELNFSHFEQIKAICRPDQLADFKALVSDLAHLFGRPQHPPHTGLDRLPDDPHKNFSSHP